MYASKCESRLLSRPCSCTSPRLESTGELYASAGARAYAGCAKGQRSIAAALPCAVRRAPRAGNTRPRACEGMEASRSRSRMRRE